MFGIDDNKIDINVHNELDDEELGRRLIASRVQTGLPIIGKLPAQKQSRILISMLLVSIIGFTGSTWMYAKSGAEKVTQDAYSRELNGLTHKLNKATLEAAFGKKSSFDELNDAKLKLDSITLALTNGGVIDDVEIKPLKSQEARDTLNKVSNNFNGFKNKVDYLITNKSDLISLEGSVSIVNTEEADLYIEAVKLRNVLSKEITSNLSQYSHHELLILDDIPSLIQRITKNVNSLYISDSFDSSLAFLIGKDLNLVKKYVDGFKNGSQAYNITKVKPEFAAQLAAFEKAYMGYYNNSRMIQTNLAKLEEAKNTVKLVSISAKGLTVDAQKLVHDIGEYETAAQNMKLLMVLFALYFIANMIGLLKISIAEGHASKIAAAEAIKNQANQEAINEMLAEMSYVAEGVLTKKIKVSNDATGAIAQAINVTVESLKDIVLNIKKASKTVAKTSEEVSDIAHELITANNAQTDKINETIKKIGRMTSDMDEVAQKTWIAREEAEKSNTASQAGKEVVNQSITKINSMRETIQESAKKIKKLGESSQAIGEVVGLIKEITKQINILALNAAINAETAGEAGRAFSIVAQEVQRLADDSGDATKKIEVMISSIQEDTNSAIAIMEKATAEMVEGAKLSDQAGQALEEIGSLSDNLVSMINMVTTEIEDKSSDMTSISLQMKELNKIAKTNTEKVQTTVDKVDEMKQISQSLEESVSDFTVE